MPGFGNIPGLGEIAVLVSLAGADKFGKELDGLTKKIRDGGITMDDILNKSLAAGTAAFTAVTIASARFETGMVNLRNTVDLTEEEFQQIEDAIKDIGSVIPLSLSQLTAGMEQLLRAGYSTDDAIAALNLTSRAAVATHTDLKDVIGAVTPAMRAYGLGVEDLESLLDMQNATLDISNVSYQALEAAMGKILPQAQGLKIPIEELYGAFAFFSQYGIDASESGQKIAMALKSITDHRPEWERLIGSIYDSQGNFIGLEALIKKLENRFKTMTPQARAATLQTLELGRSRDIIQLAANNMDEFGEAIRGVADASGDTEREFQRVAGTFTEQLAILRNNFEIAFVEIGRAVMPVLEDITNWLRENPERFQEIVKLVGELAIAFGGVSLAIKAIELGRAIAGFGSLAKILGPGAGGVLGLVGLAGALAYAIADIATESSEADRNINQLMVDFSDGQMKTKGLTDKTEDLVLQVGDLSDEEKELKGPVADINSLFGDTFKATDEIIQPTKDLKDNINDLGNSVGSATPKQNAYANAMAFAASMADLAMNGVYGYNDIVQTQIQATIAAENQQRAYAMAVAFVGEMADLATNGIYGNTNATEDATDAAKRAQEKTLAWANAIFELAGQMAGSDSEMQQFVAHLANIATTLLTGNIPGSILAIGSAIIDAFTGPGPREAFEAQQAEAEYLRSLAGQMETLGIETEESVRRQIAAYEALIPQLEVGSYEYQQVVDKLTALYEKLGEVNPLLEEQAGLVRLASIQWEIYWQTFFTDYQEFMQNIAMAQQAIADLLYFGNAVPLSETEVDEYIRGLIDDMADYIGTLDPNSQAYADAVQAYNDLIDQYNDMTQTLGDGSDELLGHWEAQGDAVDDLGDGTDDLTSSVGGAGDAMLDTANDAETLSSSMDELEFELADVSTILQDITLRLEELTSHPWPVTVTFDIDSLGDMLGSIESGASMASSVSPPGGAESVASGLTITVNEATPNTWVEVTDKAIAPRIRFKERYMTNWTSPY